MLKKIRGIFRKLDKRLILLVCLTVIPVNIMAIVFSHMTMGEAQRRVQVSYEKEFRAFMDRQLGQLERLDAWFNNFISQYLYYLANDHAFDAVESLAIINDAADMFDMYGINGIVALQERREEQRLYVKSLSGLYAFEQFEQIKSGLKGLDDVPAPQNSWYIHKAGEQYFFMRACTYVNYALGIGVDIGRELEEWFGSEMAAGSTIVLSQSGAAIACREDGGIKTATPAGEQRSEDTYGLSVCTVTDERTGIRMQLFYDVPLMGQMPAYLAMQALAWFSLIVLAVLYFVIRRQVIAPLKVLQNAMQALDGQDWKYRIRQKAHTDEYTYIYDEFNKMAEDILLSHEKDIELYKTQMNNLKLQVNPHMLLNSLTMIYSLVETQKYTLIQKYTMNLVEYFRYCLRENNALVPLKSEIRFIENYLEIQKLRYPGQLAGVYMMEEGTENALIPPLLIQNFVENSTKYARIPGKTIEVLMNIRRNNDQLLISVNDTGKGIEEDILKCLQQDGPYEDKNGLKHIGVWNCRRRLEVFYDKKAHISLTSKIDAGTQVWIELPFQEEVKT